MGFETKCVCMEKDLLHDNLLKIIKEKISKRGELSNWLTEVLQLEKEAVYRRLRGEVPFTFYEATVIARKLNVSIDHLIEVSSSDQPYFFQLKTPDFLNPSDVDLSSFEELTDAMEFADRDLASEFGFVSSSLPLRFAMKYDHIHRFHLMKWANQFTPYPSIAPYSEIGIHDKYRVVGEKYLESLQNITYTYLIWDKNMLSYLVNDIKYFASIRLIKESEVQLLKKELLQLITDLEKYADKGTYENGNKMDFYISNLNFETTYSYVDTPNYSAVFIRAFSINEIISFDKTLFQNVKMWMRSLKRSSTLISESDQFERFTFFEKQREFVETL